MSEFSKLSKKDKKMTENKVEELNKSPRFHSRGNGARDISSDKNDSLTTQNEIDL